MLKTALLVAAEAALLSACTNQPPNVASARSTGRQCFLASQVNGFGHATDDAVDVSADAHVEDHGDGPHSPTEPDGKSSAQAAALDDVDVPIESDSVDDASTARAASSS